MTDELGPRQRVRVGDLDMAVVIDGHGPDLLLLHGGGDHADILAPLRDRLAATGRRVIAPDQRGHGATPDPGELTFELMADDTAGLLGVLGTGPVDVVGWSDGGIVALVLARRHPERVRRVVAIGASLRMDSDPMPVGERDLEWIRTADPATVEFPMPVETRRRLLALWARGPELGFEDLGAITAPVLVVAADRDLITLDHTVAIFRALPSAQLAIVPGEDHMVPRARPELIAELVERFLA